jgi:hypothetical protein
MAQLPEADLKNIGRNIAAQILPDRKIEQIEVIASQDSSDQPAYFFSFLFNDDRDRQIGALLRTRLAQQLRDALLARGDASYPFIRFLSRQDWEKRERA